MRKFQRRARAARMMMQDKVIPIGIGHNRGPDWDEAFRLFVWKKAQAEAWALPDRQIVEMRLDRAQSLGMSYREYTLEILERGRHL